MTRTEAVTLFALDSWCLNQPVPSRDQLILFTTLLALRLGGLHANAASGSNSGALSNGTCVTVCPGGGELCPEGGVVAREQHDTGHAPPCTERG